MKNHRISLMEAAITATALAVIGMLIVRLFLLSGQVNQKAVELDRALEISSALVERYKEHMDVDAFFADNGLLPYTMAHMPDASVVVYKYYDAQWLPVRDENAPYQVRLVLRPEPTGYINGVYVEVYRYDTEPVLLVELQLNTLLGA